MVNDSREYPARPIVGVGAIVRKDDSVLLVQRGRSPLLGEWSLPGGALELGESLRDAAAREVLEECGIEIQVGDVADIGEWIFRDDSGKLQYHYVLIDFAATYLRGDLSATSDVTDARWVKVSDLGEFGLNDKTRQVIGKIWK